MRLENICTALQYTELSIPIYFIETCSASCGDYLHVSGLRFVFVSPFPLISNSARCAAILHLCWISRLYTYL